MVRMLLSQRMLFVLMLASLVKTDRSDQLRIESIASITGIAGRIDHTIITNVAIIREPPLEVPQPDKDRFGYLVVVPNGPFAAD